MTLNAVMAVYSSYFTKFSKPGAGYVIVVEVRPIVPVSTL